MSLLISMNSKFDDMKTEMNEMKESYNNLRTEVHNMKEVKIFAELSKFQPRY